MLSTDGLEQAEAKVYKPEPTNDRGNAPQNCLSTAPTRLSQLNATRSQSAAVAKGILPISEVFVDQMVARRDVITALDNKVLISPGGCSGV